MSTFEENLNKIFAISNARIHIAKKWPLNPASLEVVDDNLPLGLLTTII